MKTSKILSTALFLLSSYLMRAQTTVYSYVAVAPGGGSGYDADGNILNYTDDVNGTWAMTYDQLNRLQSASATAGPYQGLNLSTSYDSFGNRKTQTSAGSPPFGMVPSQWANYSSNNQITSSSVAVGGLMYDAAGDVIFDGVNNVAYDAESRVCAVYSTIGGGPVTQYLYDAEGRRVAKGHSSSNPSQLVCSTGGSDFVPIQTYVVGKSGEQVSQFDGSGNWQHSNVYATESLLATYDTQGTGLHFHISDPLGSRRVQVSSTGTLELKCSNLPFGDSLGCGPSSDATEQHFTGKERDAESGLDYFGARYYASTMGRFATPDPSGLYFADQTDPQSLNLYSYVRNRPLVNTDPDGLRCVWDDGSFDSEDDKDTGSQAQCEGGTNGGTWYDPGTYSPGVDWASADGDGTLTMHVGVGGNFGNGPRMPTASEAAVDLVLSSSGGGLIDLLTTVIYTPPNRSDPYLLFSTFYCGQGGSGPKTGIINRACAQHDKCFDDLKLSAANNAPGGPGMTDAQKAGAKACNQALYNAARANPIQGGSTALQWWLVQGSNPPFGGSLLAPGTEAKPW